MTDHTTEGTGNLIGDALKSATTLVRSEVDLARAEIDENLRRAGMAVGFLAAALVLALTALNVLSAALTAALTELGLDPGWSALIVGGLFAIVAWVLMSKGLKDLKLSSLAPTRTTENVKRDVHAAKGEVRHAK
ncbi:hypothetical protein A3731_16150 [Roseovarius sp. HI0049]|nr:hypothetical protein A3731_16150 [Roseovarius sp. HI0049]